MTRVAGQPKRWVAVTALVFSTAVNTILVIVVVTTNTHRINDVQRLNERSAAQAQASRIALAIGLRNADVKSCRRTYEGVRQIFQPFTAPLAHDPRAQGRVRKFNVRVDQLKAGCKEQTLPSKPKGTP